MNKVLSEPNVLLELLKNYHNIDHAHELQIARATDDNLQKYWLWTADFWPATNVDGKVVKYNLADAPYNLIFRHKEKAIEEILKNGFYKCDPEEMKEVFKNSEEIRSSDLKFDGGGDTYKFFKINTSNPQDLPAKNLVIAQRAHGRKIDQYVNTMNMLKNNYIRNIDITRIDMLNPDYVLKNTKPGETIARACVLGYFGDYSYFNADLRDVDYDGRRLRGVESIAEGDEKNSAEYKKALETLITPGGIEYLDKHFEEAKILYKTAVGPAFIKK